MTVSSYRLETVATNLIEQLEGRRRSYQDRPEEWGPAAARIADEALDKVSREYSEVMGESAVPARLRREIHDTFLPRYVALSKDHNVLEKRGYNAWRNGDPIARVVGFLIVFFAITIVSRVIPVGPVVIFGYLGALAVPFVPDIRAFFYRRGYMGELGTLIDDLSRIQRQLDDLPEHDPDDKIRRLPVPPRERDPNG